MSKLNHSIANITLVKGGNWNSFKKNLKKGEYSEKDKMRDSEESQIEKGIDLVKAYAETGRDAETCKADMKKGGHTEEYADTVMEKAFEMYGSTDGGSEDLDKGEEKEEGTEEKPELEKAKGKRGMMIKGKYVSLKKSETKDEEQEEEQK